MVPALLACTLLVLPPAQEIEQLGPEDLVNQAWTRLPSYEHRHRPSLNGADRQNARAAAHLLEAALALNPDHVRGLMSLGHTHILLAEDRRSRRLDAEADEELRAGVVALSRALELQPKDPWSHYALGTALAGLGDPWRAVDEFERAVALIDETLANGGGPDDLPRLRFHALEWRIETLMRGLEFERAREVMPAFHEEFSTNDWPLLTGIAESQLRERDLAAARATYQRACEAFPSEYRPFEELASVQGLLGDRAAAAAALQTTLELELVPGLYTRLYLYILATDEVRPAAEADLRAFLEHPPQSVTDWDRTLGRFVLGEGAAADFLATARAEEARRLDAGQPLDELLCEAHFFAGLRHEYDAAEAPDDGTRGALLRQALDEHAAALAFSPAKWKWEWAYARLHFARLAEEIGLAAAPPRLPDPISLESATWHVPGTERPVADPARPPRPGNLLQAVVRDGDARRVERWVIGAQGDW